MVRYHGDVMDVRDTALADARRLAADIERPLGLHVEITLQEGQDTDGADTGLVRLQVVVDSLVNVGASIQVDDPDVGAGSVYCELAKLIQEGVLAGTGKIWPAESDSSNIPLVPGPGGWRRDDTEECVVAHGEVQHAASRKPGPHRTVRWYLDYLDFGVIADDGGDLAFTYFDIVPAADDRRPIPAPGQQVTYTVKDTARGVYRSASSVTVVE